LATRTYCRGICSWQNACFFGRFGSNLGVPKPNTTWDCCAFIKAMHNPGWRLSGLPNSLTRIAQPATLLSAGLKMCCGKSIGCHLTIPPCYNPAHAYLAL